MAIDIQPMWSEDYQAIREAVIVEEKVKFCPCCMNNYEGESCPYCVKKGENDD